jgi:hypothetical protein
VSLVRFLEPAETLRFMTMPLCQEWRQSYTAHQDMWKTLCCEDPFSAKLNKRMTSAAGYESASSSEDGSHCAQEEEDDDDDDSFCTLGECNDDDDDDDENNNVLGEYRLLYTSFVRCMKYLDRIQEDVQKGRPPSTMDYGSNYSRFPTFGVTKSLKKFLSKKSNGTLRSVIGDGSGNFHSNPPNMASTSPIGVVANGSHDLQVRTYHI